MTNKENLNINQNFNCIGPTSAIDNEEVQRENTEIHFNTDYFATKKFSNSFQNPIRPATLSYDIEVNTDQDIHYQNETFLQYNETKKDKVDSSYNTKSIPMQQTVMYNKKQNTLSNSLSNTKQTSKETYFSRTQTMLDSLARLSIFDSVMLEKGIKFNMMQTNDSPFFEFFLGCNLYLACVYSYIFEERLFCKEESPRLHFLKCSELKHINSDFLKMCLPKTNAFDYRVRADGVDTRLFYEHPLRLCPMCIAELCKILSKKHNKEFSPNKIKESEIMSLILKNKLKNLVF